MTFPDRVFAGNRPRASDCRVFDELFQSNSSTGASVYTCDPNATHQAFHLRYLGRAAVDLTDVPKLLNLALARNSRDLALTGHYLVDVLPQRGPSIARKHCVSTGH